MAKMTAVKAHRVNSPHKNFTLIWEEVNVPEDGVIIDWFKKMFGYGHWEIVEKGRPLKEDRKKSI